ncbi:MAG: hypothetical protein ACRELB_23490 [Polyangiaceae bacterium]
MASRVSGVVGGVVLTGLVAWASAAGVSGCSSSSAAGSQAEAASLACPATFEATFGQPCNAEGEVCSPTFPCGFATVTVACTCQQGTFQCLDGQGNPYAQGQTPSCPGGDDGGLPACPTTETLASVAKCSAPQSGQQCAYPPKCTGGTLAYDLCTCEPVASGGGFKFSCENSCAGGTGPVPEAGSSSGGDASSGSDAAPSDASDLEAAAD